MTHELYIIPVTVINGKGVLKILSCWDSMLYLLYSFEQQRNVIIRRRTRDTEFLRRNLSSPISEAVLEYKQNSR